MSDTFVTPQDHRLADNIDTSPEELDRLLALNHYSINNKVAAHPRTSQATLAYIYRTNTNGYVLKHLASNPSIPQWMAVELSQHTNGFVRSAALKNPVLPESAAYPRLEDPEPWVRYFANRKLGRWAKMPVSRRATGISTHGSMDAEGSAFRKSALSQEERDARLRADLDAIKSGSFRRAEPAEVEGGAGTSKRELRVEQLLKPYMTDDDVKAALEVFDNDDFIAQCQDPRIIGFLYKHSHLRRDRLTMHPYFPYELLVELAKWNSLKTMIAASKNPAARSDIHERHANNRVSRRLRLAVATNPLVATRILEKLAMEDGEVGEQARANLETRREVVEALTGSRLTAIRATSTRGWVTHA